MVYVPIHVCFCRGKVHVSSHASVPCRKGKECGADDIPATSLNSGMSDKEKNQDKLEKITTKVRHGKTKACSISLFFPSKRGSHGRNFCGHRYPCES